MAPSIPKHAADPRDIVNRSDIKLTVVEVRPKLGLAYAIDQSGSRFAIGPDSSGIDAKQLHEGQELIGNVSKFFYVISARLQ